MAPGGFAKVILERYDGACLSGLSLPPEKGGHALIESAFEDLGDRFQVQYLDITMLATEFGTSLDLLSHHPEYSHFLSCRPYFTTKFDLVMADGAVLESHERGEYRTKHIEATRLRASEIVLALQRIKSGGTFIMLLHHMDAWETAELLRDFSEFAFVHVKKPTMSHMASSSFYMIAEKIHPEYAGDFAKKWKLIWRDVTIRHGCEDGTISKEDEVDSPSRQLYREMGLLQLGEADGKVSRQTRIPLLKRQSSESNDAEVSELLDYFGPKLIEMGEPVWQTQMKGLKARVGRAGSKSHTPTPRRSTIESTWGQGSRRPSETDQGEGRIGLRRDSVISSSSGQESTSTEHAAKEQVMKSGPWRPKWKETGSEQTEERYPSFVGRKPMAKLDNIRKLGNWRSPTVIKGDEADVAGLAERAGNTRPRK